jgi:hypothetical protein
MCLVSLSSCVSANLTTSAAKMCAPFRFIGLERWLGSPLKWLQWLPLLLKGWFLGRNLRFSMYTTFLQCFKYMLSVSSIQCVQAMYPLFVWPERLLSAGQSLMVTNNKARRLKSCRSCSSHILTPSLLQSCKSSSTNGLRYTSMPLPGYLGPWISTGISMNFRFMHNQGERLYMHKVTDQVLWLLLCSPKRFMPSVLSLNLMFLASPAKSSNVWSIFLHCDPSVGSLNILSSLCSSLCHCINLAWALFLNRRLRHGITGKYHITLAGTLFLFGSPSISPGCSRSTLYHNALHTGQASVDGHYKRVVASTFR